MMTDDPWRDISPPARASRISARRVTRPTRWGLYWGVDADRNILLILQHASVLGRSHRLPALRGLRVEVQPADGTSDERIVIRLTDPEQREIFLRFCQDIVEATALARTEEQAVERFLARTWRWHRLLRSGREDRLGDEAQKGLIGELVVLERHLLRTLGVLDAVRCWTGPLDAPHDFEISRVHVEAKAQGTAIPQVTISSEHQLDFGGGDTLFLHVTEVVNATEGTSGAFVVTEFASRIRSVIAEHDMVAVDLFEERLSAVGFHWTDDYSDKLWLVGRESLYEVREGFPRITSAMLSGGVDKVRYTISLPECEAFRVELAALATAVAGATDDT